MCGKNHRNIALKAILGVLFILVVLQSCTTTKKQTSLQKTAAVQYKRITKRDTISGYFLYEVNVPLLCYSESDQIEQDCALIFYADEFATKDILETYQKGVVSITFQPYIVKNNFLFSDYDNSARELHGRLLSYAYKSVDDSDRRFVKDKSGILTFKKLYAKLVVADLGDLEILVPDVSNNKCCYANKRIRNKVYFVVKVLDYKID